jgi:hypothetical protein
MDWAPGTICHIACCNRDLTAFVLRFAQGKHAIKIVATPAMAIVIAHFGFDHMSWLAVKNGSVPEPIALESGGMLREQEVEKLRAVITPQARRAFYLIHGEKGVGKSTVIVQAAHKAVGGGGKQHGGIIYIQIPPSAKQYGKKAVGSVLASAFRHSFTLFGLWENLLTSLKIRDDIKTGSRVYLVCALCALC